MFSQPSLLQTCNASRAPWAGELMKEKFTAWSSATTRTPCSALEKMARCEATSELWCADSSADWGKCGHPCVCAVHSVEHSSLWGEAVRTGSTPGCHRSFCPVRVQWIQTGKPVTMETTWTVNGRHTVHSMRSFRNVESRVERTDERPWCCERTLVQVQVPRGRLFAFDSEGQHVLTCSSTGGLIYRVNVTLIIISLTLVFLVPS